MKARWLTISDRIFHDKGFFDIRAVAGSGVNMEISHLHRIIVAKQSEFFQRECVRKKQKFDTKQPKL